MKINTKTQSREEFEGTSTKSLNSVVDEAKELRDRVRLLEKSIGDKEQKIRNYQNTFSEIQQQLVKIQAELYAGGTT